MKDNYQFPAKLWLIKSDLPELVEVTTIAGDDKFLYYFETGIPKQVTWDDVEEDEQVARTKCLKRLNIDILKLNEQLRRKIEIKEKLIGLEK